MNRKKSSTLTVLIIIGVIAAATLLFARYLCNVNKVLSALSRRLNEDDYGYMDEEDEDGEVDVEVEKAKE